MDTFRGPPQTGNVLERGRGDRGKRELNSFLVRVDFIGRVSWKIRWLVFSSKVFSVSKWQRSKIIGIIVKKKL